MEALCAALRFDIKLGPDVVVLGTALSCKPWASRLCRASPGNARATSGARYADWTLQALTEVCLIYLGGCISISEDFQHSKEILTRSKLIVSWEYQGQTAVNVWPPGSRVTSNLTHRFRLAQEMGDFQTATRAARQYITLKPMVPSASGRQSTQPGLLMHCTPRR
eukprot:scaffold14909_cov21-Tisochrysis_lutea.AAC.1